MSIWAFSPVFPIHASSKACHSLKPPLPHLRTSLSILGFTWTILSISQRTHQSSNALNASWPPNSELNSWAPSTGSLALTSSGPPTKTALSSATCHNKPIHITLSRTTALPRSTSTRSPLLTNQDVPSMLHHQQTSTRMTRYSSGAAKRTNPSLDASRGFPQRPVQTCPLQCHFLHPTEAV